MEDLKATIEDLKTMMNTLGEDGKKCKEANKTHPIDCYVHLHGPI
jgi:hypothetical protein